jgi:hypothetical protein
MATNAYGVADSLFLTGVMYGCWAAILIAYAALYEGQPGTRGYKAVGGGGGGGGGGDSASDSSTTNTAKRCFRQTRKLVSTP